MCSDKVIVASSLINREWLKQGRCSKASWVAPTWERDIPLSRVPFYSAVWAVGLQPTTGLSCSGLSSKGWFRLCVAGGREWSSVRWSRPRTMMGGTPVALPLYGIQFPIRAIRFSCAQLRWNVRCKHSSYFCILFENTRPYYNKIGFPIKCFGYRKVKTRHVYLWRGLTRYLWFQRILKTLIVQLSVFSHAGFPD